MLEGTLISESIREGTSLDNLRLTIRKLSRWAISDAAEYQPKVWTIIEFASDEDPDKLGEQLASALDGPGWYADFHTAETNYVIFPGKIVQYPRGDARRHA